MKTITFNNKQYKCPESWKEVTLRMIIKAQELSEILEDAELIAVMSAYTGIPVRELSLSKIDQVNDIMQALEFLNKIYESTPLNSFTFNDEEYKAKENLQDHNFEDWVSIQTIIVNTKENPITGLPKLIACLCKKENETIDDFSLKQRADEFLDLPMTTAKDVESFFLSNRIELEKAIEMHLMVNLQKELVLLKVKELRNTMKIRKMQVGTSLLTKLQIGTLQIYLWYLNKVLVKSFNSQSSKDLKKTSIPIWKRFRIKK